MKFRLITLLFLFTISVNAQEVFRKFALFEYNSYELTSQSRSLIDSMLLEVGNNNIVKVELYGHTDSDGDPQANQLLSENRVNTVKTYLLSKGIKESLFVTEHFGESKPAFSNSTDAGMQKNRRVEIMFSYEVQKQLPVAPVTQVTPTRISQPPTTKNSPPIIGTPQVFKENAKKKIDITGAKGTHFIFPQNCFTDANGKAVSGDVTIEIVEVYTKDDMILHNLHTTSYQKMLESGGMAYINVQNSDGEVKLVSYMPYTIEFPTTAKVSGMQLFYGDTTSGNLNWVAKSSGMKGGDWDYAAQQALDKYIFTSSRLGWVNCDKFIRDYDVTDLIVEPNDTAGVSFCLVFKDFNSVMLRDLNADEITFRNVPIGQTATLIAFRKTETGAFYGSQELKLEGNMRQSIAMVEVKDQEFQQKIAEFK